MFAASNPATFDGENIIARDYYGKPLGFKDPKIVTNKFTKFMSEAKVFALSLEQLNPLRLIDCWDDDPIGSGALSLFGTFNAVSADQGEELKEIFHPFSNVIYPVDVHTKLAQKDIQKILLRRSKDTLFHVEFEKRRKRSKTLGENFNIAAVHELVWVDYTLKLRDWALQKKYDSFVYKSNGEVIGEDSYVTLKHNQIKNPDTVYTFDSDMYLKVAAPNYISSLKKMASESIGSNKIMNTYWCGYPSDMFWKSKSLKF